MQAGEGDSGVAGWCCNLGGLTPGLLSPQGAALLQPSSLPRVVHIWNSLHVWKTPASFPLQASVASRDLCFYSCLGVVRGLLLPSPLPKGVSYP